MKQRKSISVDLKEYDHFADDHDFIEVCEWSNGEGVDVIVSSKLGGIFQLTYGEWNALKAAMTTLIYNS